MAVPIEPAEAILLNLLHPPNDLDREGQILLTLGDLYGLTIKQMMQLWGWQDYPKATMAFKKAVTNQFIYRIRRHGLGRETIPGDVYVLLTAGAHQLQTIDLHPTFSFSLEKARQLRPGGLAHTLLVNDTLSKLKRFADAAASRFRLTEITHERRMRSAYKDAFQLYPDGFIRFSLQLGKQWKQACCFLELEHTSARDSEKWRAKVRQYLTLFQDSLPTFFQTDRTFVIILVTEAAAVPHLKHLTETLLEDLGTEALTYRNWFCFGAFEKELPPLQFFAQPRFFHPFNKSPVVPFPGLILAPSRS